MGCGGVADQRLAQAFPPSEWREVRLDINPAVNPDIVASITDMAGVPDASVDALWSAHNLEHLFQHEVPLALAEFWRVLKPGAIAIIAVPDLSTVAAAVAEGRVDEPLYESDSGPILPLDVIFGFGPALAAGNHFMAHRTGFTPHSLGTALQKAGFEPVFVRRDVVGVELRAEAHRPLASES